MTEERDLAPEITSRRSVTTWKPDKLDSKTWTLLLEAARRAPSSWNNQPARYVVVDAKASLQRVYQGLHRANYWAEKAPALLIQVARPADDDVVGSQPYYLFDCGLAMMSLLLQAQRLDIDSHMMIGFDEEEVRQAISLPPDYRIVVIVALGYHAESNVAVKLQETRRRITGQHKRYAIDHLVSRQKWGETW